MPIALAVIAGAFGMLLLRTPDPDAAVRARARLPVAVWSALATAEALPAPAGMLRPSVLANRAARAPLPPLLTLPAGVASPIPAGTADARREVRFAPSELSRPTVYRLADGRWFVVQQAPPDRGRPVLATYGFEEGTVRGQPAQFFNSSVGPVRALVWWIEGPASYYLYSSTVSVRELLRMADELR